MNTHITTQTSGALQSPNVWVKHRADKDCRVAKSASPAEALHCREDAGCKDGIQNHKPGNGRTGLKNGVGQGSGAVLH